MRALRFNHVSISAPDVEASTRFYEEVFGMERIATYNFAFPVQYLRLGEQQLHLFRRDDDPPRYFHFGLDVDDFDGLYRRAKERGLLDHRMGRAAMRTHPTGWVQLYLHDPAGNLVEVDWPDVTTLAPDVAADVTRLDDEVPQTGEAERATLYHGRLPVSAVPSS